MFGAWGEFKRGKGSKADTKIFSLNLEDNIFALQKELKNMTWMGDGYISFAIQDPKPRNIHKATVKDRVLYQAIYRVIYPIFDKRFVEDVYSSRISKGTHAGINRLTSILKKISCNYTKQVFVLKCDIKKFFDTIDHKLLIDFIFEEIDCPKTKVLINRVLSTFEKFSGKGLPLGNVTSQIFANIYMNKFDWFMRRDLKCNYYLRYCDDFIIVSRDNELLRNLIPKIKNFLENTLKLELHPHKVEIRKLHQGVDFLGAVILPYRNVVRTKTKKRIIRRFKTLDMSSKKVLASYLGHLSHTKSFRIRRILQ